MWKSPYGSRQIRSKATAHPWWTWTWTSEPSKRIRLRFRPVSSYKKVLHHQNWTRQERNMKNLAKEAVTARYQRNLVEKLDVNIWDEEDSMEKTWLASRRALLRRPKRSLEFDLEPRINCGSTKNVADASTYGNQKERKTPWRKTDWRTI